MKSMLNAANIRGPKFNGASAQRWFLAHRDLLGPVQQDAFADFIDVLMLVERQRARMRRQMIFASRNGSYAATIARLMTVPGVGDIWATIIAAEIGPFERFPNADALEFWAGLTADLKESAGRTQSGQITKAGSVTLRWALCQAAVTLCLCDARQEAIRQRLVTRIGKPRANVAMGRRLLRILYAMIRDGKAYQGGPRRNRTAAANQARLRRKKQVA
jgi:transposase